MGQVFGVRRISIAPVRAERAPREMLWKALREVVLTLDMTGHLCWSEDASLRHSAKYRHRSQVVARSY